MKSSLFLFTLLFGLLLIAGCKENKTGIVIPEHVEKYPTALNTEWEYEISVSPKIMERKKNVSC